MTRSFVVACAAMAALVSLASGTKELYDGDDLAAAVADEAAYDEIVLHAGTYNIAKEITVGRPLTIRGADGTTPDQVILQGNGSGRLVRQTAANSLIAGVTLTGGKLTNPGSNTYGAAVSMSSGTVSNCIIRANHCEGKNASGIVHLEGSSALITHCQIVDNTYNRDSTTAMGNRGIIVMASSGKICGTLIARNVPTNEKKDVGTSAIIYSSATDSAGVSVLMSNCTIVGNRIPASSPSGISGVSSRGVKWGMVLVNCIIVGNVAATSQNAVMDGNVSQLNNCLTDYAGLAKGTDCQYGTTSVFADFGGGNYRLASDATAAIDKGNQTREYGNKGSTTKISVPAIDLAGEARVLGDEIDIGCYEYNPDKAQVAFVAAPDSGTEPLPVTLEVTAEGLGDAPKYYWDFDGDGVVDFVTDELTVTKVFSRGTYPITLYASNLVAGVGVSYTRMTPLVVEKGLSFDPYGTDWFFEPFGEPLKVVLTGDLGETPKFYWDVNDDGVAEAITDVPVWRPTLAAGEYHVTVCASNVEAGVGITIAAEDGMTILPRPRVTVAASDPEVGITAADIQATIDAAERGSIVTIPKGLYRTGGIPITVLKEIELRGETGNPEDVILSNNATTNRLLNVDAGPHALIHSMVLTGGKGGFDKTGTYANSSYALCASVMVANRTGFYVSANNGSRPSVGLGGCVSNVIVRSGTVTGNYSDCTAVYLKGPNARFTHSVVSNCYSSSGQNAGVVKTIALGIYGGARGEHLLVTDNYSAASGCALTAHVSGKGSVLRFSTVSNNRCSWCGGVDVYNGGRFEYCDIAGNVATAAGEGGDKTARRNVWTSYYEKDSHGNVTDENARPSWVSSKPSPKSYTNEVNQATKVAVYSIQTNNAVDVADCLNETTVYATTAELKPIFRKGAWRLPKGSPAIDVVPAKDVSGMPEKDLNGNRRLVNTLYDLGAFELPNPCGLMLLVK